MRNINNYKIRNKKILIRVDLNVPVKQGKITEKSRIDIIKQTIITLQKQQNKIFLLSHFGRPKGKKNKKYSLKFICSTLKKELKLKKIYFVDALLDNKIQNTLVKMNPRDVCLLENIRFYPEEENNNLKFTKRLSQNFDVFVNDAFSASHRKHASIIGFPKFLPSFAGPSLINEIKNINNFMNKPKKPNLAIIGGSKISTKIDLLNNLIKTCNYIVIGGAMANTFLYVKKVNIGKSLYEKKLSNIAFLILKKAKKYNCEIILPIDVVCANNLNDKIDICECDIKNVNSKQMILDIGSKSTKLISTYILRSKMILWNGPLGVIEHRPFQKSSVEIANIIKNNTRSSKITSIAGGGDTILAIKMAKAEKGFSYISKAGGAFLEWLEGKKSPGIIALEKNKIN